MTSDARSLPSRIAVTGASGYLGRRLVQRLDEDEGTERIVAIDLRPLPGRYSSKLVFRAQDICAPLADVFAEGGVEAVVHLAYLLNPGHDGAEAERINVGGTANVVDACSKAGVRHILYLSSTSVYGAHPDNAATLTEDSPVRPVKGFRYSEGKARAESILTEFVSRYPSFTATILRACPVLGSNADNFIARAFSRPILVGVGGCDPPMQFVHEDDLQDLMLLCLRRRPSGVFNVASDGTIRWSEMAATYGRRRIVLPAPILYGLTSLAWGLRLQSDSPACGLDLIRWPWVSDTDKIKRELGATFRHSSREAWEDFVGRRRPRSVKERERP